MADPGSLNESAGPPGPTGKEELREAPFFIEQAKILRAAKAEQARQPRCRVAPVDPLKAEHILREPYPPFKFPDTPEAREILKALEREGIQPIDSWPLEMRPLPAGFETLPGGTQSSNLPPADAPEETIRLAAPAEAPAPQKSSAEQSVPTAERPMAPEGTSGPGAGQPPGSPAAPAVDGATGQPEPANFGGALTAEDIQWIENLKKLVPHQTAPESAV